MKLRTDNQDCPFCNLDEGRIFYKSPLVKGIWDAFPINPGHALLIPHRHISNWFEATFEEQQTISAAIQITQLEIEKLHSPQGYNVGFNEQAAGGQTVPHLHVHVIPRYDGDVKDPRGGIRNIIPARAAYWEDEK